MPGPITRLLACDEERLKKCARRGWSVQLSRCSLLSRLFCCARSYKYLDIVPTHVHPNFARLHFADLGDDYVPYNKARRSARARTCTRSSPFPHSLAASNTGWRTAT